MTIPDKSDLNRAEARMGVFKRLENRTARIQRGQGGQWM